MGGNRFIFLAMPVDCYIERNTFLNTGAIVVILVSNTKLYVRNNIFFEQKGGYDNRGKYARKMFWGDNDSMVIAEFNSFLSTDRLSVLVISSGMINAKNNFWNTTDTTVIESMIYDRNDDLEY